MYIEPTARLTFQLMGAEDAACLFELDQDEQVMRYINGGKRSSLQQIEQVMLPRMLSYRNPEQGWGIWKVSTLASNTALPAQYIGWILVRPMAFFTDSPAFDDLELGWRFKRCSWGQGYASEAAAAISCSIAAQTPSLAAFSAIALPDNAGSIAVMKKLGMQFLRQDIHWDPLGEHEVVYYRKPLKQHSGE